MHMKDLEHVLVTGGAGFIGSHLVNRLLAQDCKVTVIDNFSSGDPSFLENYKENKLFNLVNNDLNNYNKESFSFDDITTVFHLAGYPEVRTGFEKPELSYRENIENTFILLENIRKSNVKNFVFSSSSVVYGEPTQIPTPENYAPLLPISAYGGSKLACEGLISSYCSNYGIHGIILRFANVVGLRSRHGVIWDFIMKLKKNNRMLEILGDGKQKKSYIHINDCVDGFLFCLMNSEKKIDVYNIGNNDQTDVMSIAEIIFEKMNLRDIKIIPKGGTNDGRGWIGDVKEMLLDISKLEKLGWKPKLPSQEAVKLATEEMIKEVGI